MEILGMDAGNKNVKIYGAKGAVLFPSNIGEWRERNLVTQFSPDDMEFEYAGQKGFAGTLAQFESEFSRSRLGDTKAHNHLTIRVMLGLHRYISESTEVNLVVGQPISKHNHTEKGKIQNLLQGEKSIIVNGVEKTFRIEGVTVAAEGGAAFWSNPKKGLVRILDFGSGTVNAATLIDGRYVDKDSFTLNYGMETTITKDLYALAETVCLEALKRWKQEDSILVTGGAAEELINPIGDFFLNPNILMPKIKTDEGFISLPTIYANAVGFYLIGRKVYGGEN